MKKFYYLIAMAVMAFTFTSCEDVPEPYGQPTNPNSSTSVDPAGTGTEADPFNIAGAIAKCKEIGSTVSTDKYYVKGYAATAATADATYGNVSFDMTDSKDGKGKKFKAYQVAGSDGQKLAAGYTINIGDEVVIYGPMYNYNGSTPETASKAAAYIVTVNGQKTNGTSGGGGDTPTGDYGTKDAPLTVAKALEVINGLEDNGTVSSAYVKGKISKVQSFNSNYKSITYYISDDGTDNNALQVYSGKGIDGADFAAQTDLETGWTVVVTGELKKYVNSKTGAVTLEINQSSKIVSIDKTTGGSTGGGDTPSGDILNVSFANGQGDFTIDNKEIGSMSFVWNADSKGYMKASAFVNSANNASESWLVSPAFSLKNATAPVMTFNNACNFVKEGTITDHIKVMVYDGANWAEATITSLPDGKSWTFVDSSVDLKAYAGKEGVKVAFKYVSTTAVAPTWEIKTVVIK